MRTVEDRARRSNGEAQSDAVEGRRARATRGVHPDQAAAAAEIEASWGEALGAEVRARPQADGSYRVELSFESSEEALALASRVGARVGS